MHPSSLWVLWSGVASLGQGQQHYVPKKLGQLTIWIQWMARFFNQWIVFFPDGTGIFQDDNAAFHRAERVVQGARDIIFTYGLVTTESRPEPHWESLGCAGEDFTQRPDSLISPSVQDLGEKCMQLWTEINAVTASANQNNTTVQQNTVPFFFFFKPGSLHILHIVSVNFWPQQDISFQLLLRAPKHSHLSWFKQQQTSVSSKENLGTLPAQL